MLPLSAKHVVFARNQACVQCIIATLRLQLLAGLQLLCACDQHALQYQMQHRNTPEDCGVDKARADGRGKDAAPLQPPLQLGSEQHVAQLGLRVLREPAQRSTSQHIANPAV
jgi:hypothetical protein